MICEKYSVKISGGKHSIEVYKKKDETISHKANQAANMGHCKTHLFANQQNKNKKKKKNKTKTKKKKKQKQKKKKKKAKQTSFVKSKVFILILSRIFLAGCKKASSTFEDVFADVSINNNPCFFANSSPSSLLTTLLDSRSLFFFFFLFLFLFCFVLFCLFVLFLLVFCLFL